MSRWPVTTSKEGCANAVTGEHKHVDAWQASKDGKAIGVRPHIFFTQSYILDGGGESDPTWVKAPTSWFDRWLFGTLESRFEEAIKKARARIDRFEPELDHQALAELAAARDKVK